MTSAGVETTPQVLDDGATPDPDAAAPYREVRYEYSLNLAPILAHLGASLLVSTYQAGKLVVVGLHQGALALVVLHNFQSVLANPGILGMMA
jgi:hypothetical protein